MIQEINTDTIRQYAAKLHTLLISEGLAPSDFQISKAQDLFSKSLGYTNWLELNEKIKSTIPLQSLEQNMLEEKVNDKPLIMVIDDSDTIRKAITLFIKNEFDCLCFDNSKSALNYLQNCGPENNIQPHLIICDVQLPLSINGVASLEVNFTSGYNFIKTYIETNDRLKNIPVVFLRNEKTNNSHIHDHIDETLLSLTNNKEFLALIQTLKTYINSNEGAVDAHYWYMLMNAYQKSNNENDFKKVAFSFSQLFNMSVPNWSDDLSQLTIDKYSDYHYLYKPFSKQNLNELLHELL